MNQTNSNTRSLVVLQKQAENQRYFAVDLKCVEDYLSPEFCLSCAYFQQTKGHFGFCKEGSNQRTYDGSRKGSGCLCYRTKTDLIGVEKTVEIKKITHNPIMYEYSKNRTVLGRGRKVKKSLPSEGKLQGKKIPFDLYKLPYRLTSELTPKKGYYDHQTPSIIIDYAIDKMDSATSLMEIVHSIYERFGYSISYNSVKKWIEKFKPELLEKFTKNISHYSFDNKYNHSFSTRIFETCVCGSNNTEWIKHGTRKTNRGIVQRLTCKNCGKKFMDNIDGLQDKRISMKLLIQIIEKEMSGFSHQKISDFIMQKYRKRISRHSILNYVNHINDNMIDDLSAKKILFGSVT